MLVQTILQRPQDIQSIDAQGVTVDQGAGNTVDNITRIYAAHPFSGVLRFQFRQILLFEPFNFFPIVKLHLFGQIHSLLLGFLQPGEDGENCRRMQGVRGNVDMLQITLGDQFLVNFDFLTNLQVVRNRDNNNPGMQRLILFIGNKALVLRLIGMGDNHLIG